MNQDMMQDLEEILYTEEQLQTRIAEVGAEISRDYRDRFPLVVGVLKGVVPFYASLTNRISIPIEEDFICVSSYVGSESTGSLIIRKDLDRDIHGRHILLVEDVLDSGTTLYAVRHNLLARGAASVKICTLLDKPSGRKMDIQSDYVGFLCPDAFIVGFGLDYNEYYRNLPFVAALKREIYEKYGPRYGL